MILPVNENKRWWQFWLSNHADVAESTVRAAIWPSQADEAMSQGALALVRRMEQLPSVGRVTKVTAPPEYDPTKKVTGGRVTRVMPRQLRDIKEGQEHVE